MYLSDVRVGEAHRVRDIVVRLPAGPLPNEINDITTPDTNKKKVSRGKPWTSIGVSCRAVLTHESVLYRVAFTGISSLQLGLFTDATYHHAIAQG